MSELAVTAADERVLAEAPSGEVVDLSDLTEEQRVVTPELIRRLCVGSEAQSVDARGVRIKGGRVEEVLDLSFCNVRHPLRFETMIFTVAPNLSEARLPALWITGCSLPGMESVGLQIDGDLRLSSSEVTGAVLLPRAKIGGDLECEGATLGDEGGFALIADGAEINGRVFLRRGFRTTGQVRLNGAKIGGDLDCEGAKLSNENAAALVADKAEIKGGVVFGKGFRAVGEVRLLGAKIGGALACVGATLSNERADALSADNAEINGGVMFRQGSGAIGAVRLLGAKIGGDLDCSGATLSNEGGPALFADGAEVNGGVVLREGIVIGVVRLPSAKIGGDLDCDGATLSDKDGAALVADGVEVNGRVFLRAGFSATGIVLLLGARIGGDLDCEDATLRNEGGFALVADTAEINGHVFLRRGFCTTGEVRLHGAKIGGDLDCVAATLSNENGNALSADNAEINGGVLLHEGFSATGQVSLLHVKVGSDLDCRDATLVNRKGVDPNALAAEDATVGRGIIFRRVRVTGGIDLFHASAAILDDDLGRSDDPLGSWQGVQPLVLDGFTYARFGHQTESSSKLRGRWLKQTRGFQQSQNLGFQQTAWQQLIEVYRSQGRDDDATRAAIAMQNDRVERAGLRWYRRLGRRALGIFIGHGYRPWLAGIWAVGVIAAFALVVWHWSGMFVSTKQGVIGPPQPVAYSTDTFLPIVDLGQAGDWTPTGWTRWVDWGVILFGWALTTIFVAGFTRIVRSE